MEPHRLERADVAIKAFRTQVRMLAAVAESVAASLERGASGEAEPHTLDLTALVHRLEELNPLLTVLADEVRKKALAAFDNPPPGDSAFPATIPARATDFMP